MTTVHGGASHTSLVAVTEAGGGGVTSGGHLGVLSGVGLAVSLPEWSLAGTLGVVVGGGWAEALFLLVMTSQQELEDSSHQEEENGTNGDGEAGGVQAACITIVARARSCFSGQAITDGGIDKTSAAVGTVAGIVGDGGKASGKADVEEDGDEGEDSDTAQAQGEENTKDGVQSRSTGHTLNGLLPGRDGHVMSRQDGEEV